MVLSNNIQIYLTNEGITEYGFERLCGLPNGILGKWRTGAYKSTSIATVEKIAEATKIPAAKWITEGGIRERKHKQKN